VQSRLDEIENRLDEIEELRKTEYSAEQKGFAGVIISLRNDGQPDIHRGLVKPEDKRQMNTVKSGGSADTSGITEVDQGDSGLSAALVEDLTTHRTAAMRVELTTQPQVALVTITHSLAVQMCYETPAWDLPTTVAIAVERNSLPLDGHAKDIELSPAQKALNEKREHFQGILPVDPKKLWGWLLERDHSEVMDLLAFCVAQTVNAVRLPHQSSLSRHAAGDDLADALSLDMTAWWTPTVDGYLGRVKKDRLIAWVYQLDFTNEQLPKEQNERFRKPSDCPVHEMKRSLIGKRARGCAFPAAYASFSSSFKSQLPSSMPIPTIRSNDG
jgi:ParB family transcriptional regulator, chromosome partitioning protein